MARRYRVDARVRIANLFIGLATRLGLVPARQHLLTTVGRRSGRRVATPVMVSEYEGQRWLVSPYGQRGWVENVRMNGEASLRRGRYRQRVRLEEITDPLLAGRVLRQYAADTPITRPYFEAAVDDTAEAFAAEAARHPVFRVQARSD